MPECANQADKYSYIIALVTIIVIILLELYRSILRTLAYLTPDAYSKPCQISKMMRHFENPGIVRTVYSGIFRHVQVHSAILRTSIQALSFCRTPNLKSLTVSWIRLCLDNCSVICAVTLCYVLHQTHSEFWHIQNSIYSYILRQIQGYSVCLRLSHACWGNAKAYSGLLRHIQHPL